MKKILLSLLVLFAISACSTGKTVDVKSPCVSGEDGPCGPKTSVNAHWLS